MAIKLSASQIEELYNFTRTHYVEYYDLQTELVDHIANGIEEQMEQHPHISFKEALRLEFKKFGVHGFEDVILERKKAMTKQYWKIIFRFFKAYFKLPKFLLTMALIYVLTFLFELISVTYKHHVYIGLLFVIVYSVFILQYLRQRKYKSEILKENKKWLLKEQIFSFGNYLTIVHMIPLFLNSSFINKIVTSNTFYIDLVFAMLIICLLMLSYIVVFVLPSKAEELLEKTYPEYKIT